MQVVYQPVDNYPFYSLTQFTQLQPLTRSKTTIYLYQHIESQQILVVKEIPYSQQTLKICDAVLKRQSHDGIVRVRGLCHMVIKSDQTHKKRNSELNGEVLSDDLGGQNRRKKKVKTNQSLLLFMEKCECNLVEYIRIRRKQRKPFKLKQISSFMRQALILLQTLEREDKISHRDIKPQNFLYDHGRYRLCDFEDAVCYQFKEKEPAELDLTTIDYTSPEFYRNFRKTKQKLFDPFKLDVFALGITILYICSMGRFDLTERRQYMIENSSYHQNYLKEQRRKILKNNDQYKPLNSIVKIMLEEDEYKRDTFTTLMLKINPIFNFHTGCQEEQDMISDYSRSEESRRKLKRGGQPVKKTKKKWRGSTQIQKKSMYSLLLFGFSFFILLLLI